MPRSACSKRASPSTVRSTRASSCPTRKRRKLMPKFDIEIYREYTITEGFRRVIEAPDKDAAIARAQEIASDSNMDCPDDCSEIEGGYTEAGDFQVDHDDVRDSNAPADEVVEEGDAEA